MSDREPDSLRVLALIQQLQDRFGAQELGQIMQTLLALTFREAGFHVVKNAVGVPDLQAFRPGTSPGFAIEAKTGEESISLTKRDLEGVMSTGRTPVLAGFFLSDPNPRWWLVDARSLKATTYRRYEISAKPVIDVGFDLTVHFSRTLAERFSIAIEGPAPLARLLSD
jgi:Holliday junction resolvase